MGINTRFYEGEHPGEIRLLEKRRATEQAERAFVEETIAGMRELIAADPERERSDWWEFVFRAMRRYGYDALAALKTPNCEICGVLFEKTISVCKEHGVRKNDCDECRRAAWHTHVRLARMGKEPAGGFDETFATYLHSVNGPTPNVDHSHEYGTVRGVLCAKCNLALGLLGDSFHVATRAAEYLSAALSSGVQRSGEVSFEWQPRR